MPVRQARAARTPPMPARILHTSSDTRRAPLPDHGATIASTRFSAERRRREARSEHHMPGRQGISAPVPRAAKAVFQDDVGAVAEKVEGLTIKDPLQPPMEGDVRLGHAQLSLPIVGTHTNSASCQLESLRQRGLAGAWESTEQRHRRDSAISVCRRSCWMSAAAESSFGHPGSLSPGRGPQQPVTRPTPVGKSSQANGAAARRTGGSTDRCSDISQRNSSPSSPAQPGRSGSVRRRQRVPASGRVGRPVCAVGRRGPCRGSA